MNVHYYSDESRGRFVSINNITLTEGQSLNPGLKVEQITREGVILNYQGHRFILMINQNL